ncbi:glycosyl transferase [Pseudomonas oryzihabitans]|uniref:LpxL/LpxP family acyltransferase n=1 Tax=Pseudomonas oryzihabitans TaxID=47885 RepID=UPI002894787C|nr:glycosyl transferase [Pseudomonas oryzihabitans]MDT3722187.1 glycosyl transferase [Pseudomonas oryzihabitans]
MSGHWAQQRERGSPLLMRLTAWLARHLGRRAIAPLLRLIVLYFFLFGGRARRGIQEYQQRLAAWSGRAELGPSWRSGYAQFMAFAEALLDKLDAWNGRLGLDQVQLHDDDQVHARMNAPRGEILVTAHLGNLEVCRALAQLGRRVRLNVLVHTRHAEAFNRLLEEAGASDLRLVQVSELDPAVMLQLSERLERGEWLAIAGDRVPLHGGRTVAVDFLGAPAPFPQGPWLLAHLLRCPTNLLFCLRQDDGYHVYLEDFAPIPAWRRQERAAGIQGLAQAYAERLAAYCLKAPRQWFNFYPFWNRDER